MCYVYMYVAAYIYILHICNNINYKHSGISGGFRHIRSQTVIINLPYKNIDCIFCKGGRGDCVQCTLYTSEQYPYSILYRTSGYQSYLKKIIFIKFSSCSHFFLSLGMIIKFGKFDVSLCFCFFQSS